MSLSVVSIPVTTASHYPGAFFIGNEANGASGLAEYDSPTSQSPRTLVYVWHTNFPSRVGNTCGIVNGTGVALDVYLSPLDATASLTPSNAVGKNAYENNSNAAYLGDVKMDTLYGISLSVASGEGSFSIVNPYGHFYRYGGVSYYWLADTGYISISPIENSSYAFLRWSDNSTGAKTIRKNDGDVSLSAYFAPKFTVKFNANGGSGSMGNQSLVYGDGSGKKLSANKFAAPAPSQYMVFDGWNTKANGSGVAFADKTSADSVFVNAGLSAGGTVTLYAQWRFIGFTVTVTNSTGVGTLTLVRVSDGAVLATESGGTLTYTGSAGVEYHVKCTMPEGYVAPAGISGLDDDTFTPSEGEIVSYSYSTSFYAIVLPDADEHGNSLAVTSPASPDTTISVSGVDKPAYAKGRNVVVTATCADEWSLTAAYLDDLQGYNQASYTGDAVAGGAFTIRSIQQSYAVRATFGEKHYTVSAAADEPSGSVLTVSASASYVVKDTSVTFTATAATGYAFEGWYLDGEKVSSSAEYTRTIDADTALVAKAKVSVSLDITSNDVSLEDYASLEVDGEAYTPATEFYVVLGDSFSYALTVTAANKYFNGWFVKPYVPETSVPLAGYGDTKTVTPTEALDIVALIGDIDPTAPVQASFAYANGSDSTMGTFSVDGVVGPQTVELGYIEQVAPTVTLAAQPKNGYIFTGWFTSASAQGNPIEIGSDGVFSVAYSRTIYARFDKNTHSICEWEGSTVPKALTWRTKTYEASKPFNPSSCRVDTLGYAGDERDTLLEFTVDMYSAPDVNARPTATTTLRNIANQDARRLPVRRMERYMQVEVKADAEVDALLVGTSMGGLAQ